MGGLWGSSQYQTTRSKPLFWYRGEVLTKETNTVQNNTKESFTQPPARGVDQKKFGMPSWDTWHILSHFLVQKQQQKMPLPPSMLTAIIFSDNGCLTQAWGDLFNPSPTIQILFNLCWNWNFQPVLFDPRQSINQLWRKKSFKCWALRSYQVRPNKMQS